MPEVTTEEAYYTKLLLSSIMPEHESNAQLCLKFKKKIASLFTRFCEDSNKKKQIYYLKLQMKTVTFRPLRTNSLQGWIVLFTILLQYNDTVLSKLQLRSRNFYQTTN